MNLINHISEFDNVARIIALRGITHSCMAKAIGALRQHMRDQARKQRDEESGINSVDQRGEQDDRGIEYTANAMGFPVSVSAFEQAKAYHRMYEWSKDELMTLATNRFEEPMDVDNMLTFMSSKTQPLDEGLVKALAAVIKVPEAQLRKLHELQDRKDRENFIAMLPEIRATFIGMAGATQTDEDGYYLAEHADRPDNFEALPPLVQHQMAIKVIDSLYKGRDQVAINVMRTKRLTQLGNIPLIEAAAKKVEEWVADFERTNAHVFEEAVASGANIRTMEEAAAQRAQ